MVRHWCVPWHWGTHRNSSIRSWTQRGRHSSPKKESPSSHSQDERVLCLSLDVTNEQQAHSAAQAAIEYSGQIDVLVNNAGYGLLGAIEETSGSEAKAIFDTNVFGLLNVTRAVLPFMRKRAGHIVNMSSLGGYQASPG